MNRVYAFSTILLALTLMGVVVVDEPPSRLDVTVPDIVVSTMGNVDVVEIPGGDLLLIEQGRPQVPYFSVSQDYPPGYRVQDVKLLEKSEPEAHPGLNLSVVILEDQPELPVEMIPGWYPEEDFTWHIWENFNGSSTLRLDLYPFRYRPESREALFYKVYQFEVDYIRSDVTIQRLQAEIDEGGAATLEGWIQITGPPQDLLVEAVIKCYGSDAIVAGLPIRHLVDFSGEGSFSMVWHGSDDAPETLYAEVILTDLSGNVLARNVAPLLKPSADEEVTPTASAKTPTLTKTGRLLLIVLIVVGGLVAVALVFAGFVFILTRRGRQR